VGLAQVRLALAPVRPAQVRLALGLAQVRLAQVGLGVALEVLPDHPQEVGPVAVIPQWISQVECRRRECPGIESDSRRAAGARTSRSRTGSIQPSVGCRINSVERRSSATFQCARSSISIFLRRAWAPWSDVTLDPLTDHSPQGHKINRRLEPCKFGDENDRRRAVAALHPV